jgi:tripartite-type tricarboxylate transporter receptor subunit TctC
VLAELKAGRVRLLGVSAPERLSGALAGAPTWKEHSVNCVIGEVVNVPGDGARWAWTNYIDNYRGDGHVIGISSPNLTSDYLVGIAGFEHSRYTAIATLVNEYIAFAVRSDSWLCSTL